MFWQNVVILLWSSGTSTCLIYICFNMLFIKFTKGPLAFSKKMVFCAKWWQHQQDSFWHCSHGNGGQQPQNICHSKTADIKPQFLLLGCSQCFQQVLTWHHTRGFTLNCATGIQLSVGRIYLISELRVFEQSKERSRSACLVLSSVALPYISRLYFRHS